MIKVSRLDGSELVVNAELIETIETTPDTVLTLTTEKKLIVREPLDEVMARVLAYRQRVNQPIACEAAERSLMSA
jgi:flagellar protein FlbD